MFPVKHTVIYTFFAITSVQNTCFCSVFNALASKNPAKSCYVQCFFHFWPFFHCRKATKMTQNSISIPSCAQTPKNPRKMSKTPPDSGLGAKPFLAPPPAKADIATAILTNVIEHLVLLLPPNKHAFTAKAVWADFKPPSSGSTYCSSSSNLLARKKTTLQTSTDMLFWVSKKMPDLLGWDSTGHAPVVPGDKKFSIPGAMADSCIARGMLRDTQWAWPKTSIKIKDSNLWPFWMNNLVILS